MNSCVGSVHEMLSISKLICNQWFWFAVFVLDFLCSASAGMHSLPFLFLFHTLFVEIQKWEWAEEKNSQSEWIYSSECVCPRHNLHSIYIHIHTWLKWWHLNWSQFLTSTMQRAMKKKHLHNSKSMCKGDCVDQLMDRHHQLVSDVLILIQECRWWPTSDHLFTDFVHSFHSSFFSNYSLFVTKTLSRSGEIITQIERIEKSEQATKNDEAKVNVPMTTIHLIFNYVIHIFMLQFTEPFLFFFVGNRVSIAKAIELMLANDKKPPEN